MTDLPKPYYERDGITIYVGDNRDVLPHIGQVSAVVTDPPYGLSFMGKGWDHSVPGVEFWEAIAEAMLTGAHLLAFGGDRTMHRMMTAIEDAGLEIRTQLAWIFGSGFPKSRSMRDIGRPELGTALKPAMELICMARNPFKGTVAANVLQHGTGAINVDACRIGTTKDVPSLTGKMADINSDITYSGGWGARRLTDSGMNPNIGRWPANVILDEDAAAVLDEQSGERKSGGGERRKRDDKGRTIFDGGWKANGKEWEASTGGASRFFYVAKASRRDRSANGTVDNIHPTCKPTTLMKYLIQMITPPGGVILDPFMGSGSTLVAAAELGFHAIGIELSEEYAEVAARRIDHALNACAGKLPGMEVFA